MNRMTKIRRSTPRRWSSARTLAGSVLLSVATMQAATADDTEVFFPEELVTVEGSISPNILFILDTSGSMSNTDGFSQTRLERMQEAMIGLLNEMNQNINVGLMRLSDKEGGPILFPVSGIDRLVSSIEANGGNQVASFATDGTNNEGLEVLSSGQVQLGAEFPQVGTVPSSTTSVEYVITDLANEAEEAENGNVNTAGERDSNDYELVQDGNLSNDGDGNGNRGRQTVGLRFPGFTMPAGATLASARLVFTMAADDSVDTDLIIEGHDFGDSQPFVPGINSNVSNRARTTARTVWANLPAPGSGNQLISPDVSGIVSEIMARPDWQDGDPVTFIITGSGERTVEGARGSKSDSVRPRLEVSYSTSTERQAAAFRFDKVTIPQGVSIDSAVLELSQGDISNTDGLTVRVRIEAADDSAPLQATTSNISGRSYSGNSTLWTMPGFSAPGDSVSSPNLATLVNGIISRSNWCGGNALTISLEPVSGTGFRSIVGTEADPAAAPSLRLSFDPEDPALRTGCTTTVISRQISSGNDDVEESNPPGSVSRGSGDLDFGETSNGPNLVGVRFEDILIPQGTRILNARIEFTAESDQSASTNLTIRGEDVDDAGGFSSSSGSLNARRSANSTSASVAWSNVPTWTQDTVYDTPNIGPIVQEIVNRSGWASGGAMAFFISGTGRREAWTVNGKPSGAPRLVIEAEGAVGLFTVREKLKQLVEDFSPVGFTPIPEVLYEAARYFRGEAAVYGRTRGAGASIDQDDYDNGRLNNSARMRISHPAAFDYSASSPTFVYPSGCTDESLNSSDCATQRITGSAIYKSPMEASCQANNIVLLSDGQPNQNEAVSIIEAMIGKQCNDRTGGDACGASLAEYLADVDQSSAVDGSQKIRTYTIGFADLSSADFLRSVASAGDGEFFTANSSSELVDVFRAIVADIQDINTTFVAPAVTVNTFNRLTHRNELYFAIFRPFYETKWEGNLKRYKIDGDPPRIVDVNNQLAVDEGTGFFKETAKSFWTDGAADGAEVQIGGAAGELTTSRRLYTYTGGAAPNNVDLTASTNALHESNASLTKALLGIGSESDAYRETLIKYSRSVDTEDDDGDGDTTDIRHSLGDPLHSEPALVTYGGTQANPDITIFYGTNEGTLHAINADDGSEVFGFVPKELLPNLNTFYRNAVNYLGRPYGVDGKISSWVNDKNGNLRILDSAGTVEPNEHVYLYFGLRRGGRSYYGMDVTDRSTPRLRFQINGGTGDFQELGQSWSAPVVSDVKFNGATRKVLIFSGGYDPAQDSGGAPSTDSQGRALYVVDASTGARLWWAGFDDPGSNNDPNLAMATMQYSTPATPQPIDLDGDGLVDRIYLLDVAGQVFRFNINQGNNGAGNFATGRRIADLRESGTGNGRRFYNSPDIALIKKNVSSPFISLSFGSGYRAHPLNLQARDRFYSLRDPDYAVDTDTAVSINPNRLFDATDNLIGEGTESEQATAQAALAVAEGIYIDLVSAGGTLKGEKVLTTSTTFDNKVIFATFEPGARATQNCQATLGKSRLYLFNITDGQPVENFDELGEDNELRRTDRSRTLSQGGLPPDPVVLFPEVNGQLPQEALVCVGPECLNPNLTINTTKTFWQQLE